MNILAFLLTITLFVNTPEAIVYDFTASSSIRNWIVVDDGVMGGLSKGELNLNKNGFGVFQGWVTTENNGGFSSIRYNFEPKQTSGYSHVVLKIKGDGKNYQFRIKKSRFDRASYINTFNTSGDWEEIKIPLSNFYPSFRGYKLNRPNYDGSLMEEIAFLIANKRNESFKLTIDKIYLE